MIEGLPRNAIVIVNLVNPKEKFWGILLSVSAAGLTLRGINLDSFEDWVRQLVSREETSIDLVTMFFPLFRLERMFLDEPVGAIRSYSDHFTEIVGMRPEKYIGIVAGNEDVH
jgi:hypothetical protein